jgi:cell division protein FtsL
MSVTRRQLLAAVALAALVTASAVWTVATEHESRRLFVELEELRREQDRLQSDWWRLQLEQSTWATHARIESTARDRLGLSEPSQERVRVVRELEP